MNKDYIKDTLIGFYKLTVYAGVLSIFIFFMGMINDIVLLMTRVSVVTIFSYVFVIIMMIPVYGNFEIGVRKSKPVIYSSLISVFIANVVSFMVIVILTNERIHFAQFFTKGVALLTVTFIFQFLFLWLAAHLGNLLYFSIYRPSRTIILNNGHEDFVKIEQYVRSYSKQYELINVYDSPRLEDVDFRGVSTVFSVGMNSNFDNKLIKFCYYNEIDFIYNSEIHNVFSGHNITLVIDDILMIHFPKKKMTAIQMILKRVMDFVLSLILIVFASPIFIIVAIAIKRNDGGPIFYTQKRLTQNGRIFSIIKFRSMKVNSGNEPVQANDDRITSVGRKIRKYRLDELPQFFNILKGDMSLVGPRPESIEIMDRITADLPEFRFRLKAKGGLTGYAQIFGKYNTSPKKKLLLDLKYIESYSVVNDIKLLLQTVIVFFKSDSTEPFEKK